MKHRLPIIAILIMCLSSIGPGDSSAQEFSTVHMSSNRDSLYRVEFFAEAGPLASIFLHKRVLPDNVSSVTAGYIGMIRLKWHPNHLVSVGVLTGFEHLVSDKYTIRDANGSSHISASLTAVPIMLDVSLSKWGFELGAATGFCIFTTWLTDGPTAIARRWELGTIYHGAYFAPVGHGLSLGGELLIGYANYRAIMTLSPQIILKYELLSY